MSKIVEILQSLLGRRPAYLQVGAVCLRNRKGRREVLMISSLDTGRWIIPKGWPMRGRSLAGAALREAWEEAGIRGHVRHEPLGSFTYDKQRDGVITSYSIHYTKLYDAWSMAVAASALAGSSVGRLSMTMLCTRAANSRAQASLSPSLPPK